MEVYPAIYRGVIVKQTGIVNHRGWNWTAVARCRTINRVCWRWAVVLLSRPTSARSLVAAAHGWLARARQLHVNDGSTGRRHYVMRNPTDCIALSLSLSTCLCIWRIAACGCALAALDDVENTRQCKGKDENCVFTARRYASAVYAVVMSPSVCPSVTRRYCNETTGRIELIVGIEVSFYLSHTVL